MSSRVFTFTLFTCAVSVVYQEMCLFNITKTKEMLLIGFTETCVIMSSCHSSLLKRQPQFALGFTSYLLYCVNCRE